MITEAPAELRLHYIEEINMCQLRNTLTFDLTVCKSLVLVLRRLRVGG
jgi:hypothetical protein